VFHKQEEWMLANGERKLLTAENAAAAKKELALSAVWALSAVILNYQTWQALSLTMGWPALHPQAFWNSGMFCTTPFTRQCPGE
jgi:hypothetical protein